MFLSILFDLLLRPGWKYNYHELRGVPIRIEIGLKDIEANAVTAVRRVDGSRASIVRIVSVNVAVRLCWVSAVCSSFL